MMKPLIECLQDEEVGRLLTGEVDAARTSELEQHLANCIDCRQRLEQQVGDDGWWNETESSLRSQQVASHVAASLRDAEDAEPDAASLGETRLRESVLDLLGPTDDPNMLGRIGPYEIIGLLGQGGMGAVFKGFDRSLNRFVAIKMLLPHLAASGAARKRFAREGQAVAAVVDDHVMAIHCVDEWQGVPYLVMTYSRGVSLQKRLSDNGPLEVREILRIGMQAAKGLAAAHAQGIVHRDIKPANIFLDQTVERVQLMDFVLARAVDDASLTRSGTLAGTPQYMSPEQARAETVDHRSDLFSLGSVMYAMCTGHAPFRAESSYSVLRLITDKEPRPIREINTDVPEWLCAIIGKLMAKQASDRIDSASQVAELLEACLAHIQRPADVHLPKSLRSHLRPRSLIRRISSIGVPLMLTMFSAILFAMFMLQSTEYPEQTASNSLSDDATSNYFVAPISTELQRFVLSFHGDTNADTYVAVNINSLIVNDDMNMSAFDKEGFVTALSKVARHRSHLLLSCRYDGRVKVDTKLCKRLSQRVKELAASSGYKEISVHEIWTSENWNDAYHHLDGFNEPDETQEPLTENEFVRVFPVRTRLSKFLSSGADCIVEVIRPIDGRMNEFPSDLESAIRKAVQGIQPTEKHSMFFSLCSTAAGQDKIEDWFNPLPATKSSVALTIAQDLGYESIRVRHSPFGGAPETIVSRKAPDFKLPQLNGAELDLHEFIQGQPALITFWGLACGPCLKEASVLTELHEKYKHEFSIIAVNGYNDSREAVSTYAESKRLSHPIILNGKSVSDDLYHVGAYPTTFWVDEEGTIIDYEVGASSIKRLGDRISSLLK